jgi:hypothetical protein
MGCAQPDQAVQEETFTPSRNADALLPSPLEGEGWEGGRARPICLGLWPAGIGALAATW